jgi:predicted kinase
MNRRIILVSGYAASGKTRVGRELARRIGPGCFLDKDTLTSPLVERLLRALGQPAEDRDSELYRREVRPLEYECLLAAGLEAAESGAVAILSAPFLAQLVDADWMAGMNHEASVRGLRTQVVWVHCNRAILFQRMKCRGSPRDRSKLDNWPAYSASIDEHLPRRLACGYLCFDNSGRSSFEVEMGRLIAKLNHQCALPT